MPNTDPHIAACVYGDARWGRLLLRRAWMVDPSDGRDFVGDVLGAGGEIAAAQPVIDGLPYGCVVVDAAGLVVCGARTRVWGGFTTLCCRPNADQPIDSELVNEGIEISSALAHGGRSVIEEQVTAGVAVRMAALCQLNAGEGD